MRISDLISFKIFAGLVTCSISTPAPCSPLPNFPQESPTATPTPVPKQSTEEATTKTEETTTKVESEVRTVPDGGSATSFNEISSEDPAQVH